MLHACVQRFDVTRNLENFCKILGTKPALFLDDDKKMEIHIFFLIEKTGFVFHIKFFFITAQILQEHS